MRAFTIRSLCALLLAGSFAHSAPLPSGKAAGLTKIKVCVPHFREEFLTLAVMAAQDHGFFTKNGLDVSLIPVANTPKKGMHKKPLENGELPPNLLNDFNVAQTLSRSPQTCQFGASNVERFLTKSDEAQDDTVPLLLSSYGEDYDTHLVVAQNSKIKTVADLKGKTIRLGQAPVRIAMEGILSEAGLTLSDIKQDYSIPSTAVLAKLESGQIDAAVTYVPTMPYMLATGKVRVLKANIVKSYLGVSIPHSLLIANRKYAETQREVVTRFIAAINEATQYLRRNPSEAVYALQRNTSLLGHGHWTVDKVTVEKAGEFVGKINTVDLFSESANRAEALDELKNYGEMLRTHGMTAQQVNLSHWLGVETKESTVTSLQ